MWRKVTVRCVGREGLSEVCCVSSLKCEDKSPLGVQKLSMSYEKWLLFMQVCYLNCVSQGPVK